MVIPCKPLDERQYLEDPHQLGRIIFTDREHFRCDESVSYSEAAGDIQAKLPWLGEAPSLSGPFFQQQKAPSVGLREEGELV